MGEVIAPTSFAAGAVRALAQLADLRGQLGDELVVDGLLDVDPLDRDADLAGVDHPAPGRGVDGAVEVGVGEDDHRVLAAELEADRGQRLGGPRHHLAAGAVGAGELDEVDGVDQGGAGLADALDAVEDAGPPISSFQALIIWAMPSGVNSEGLTTTAAPACRAGIASPSASVSGKFQGLITPTTG